MTKKASFDILLRSAAANYAILVSSNFLANTAQAGLRKVKVIWFQTQRFQTKNARRVEKSSADVHSTTT